jgi:hypothetical protein
MVPLCVNRMQREPSGVTKLVNSREELNIRAATLEQLGYLARLRNRRGVIGVPMASVWHINIEEMLSGLMAAIFRILLAACFAVVSLMVLLPLSDLAFKQKPVTRPHKDLIAQDDSWQAGRPWLLLRSNFLMEMMSGLVPAQLRHLTLVHDIDQFPEARHRTPLIKRAAKGTHTDTSLIVPEAKPNQASTRSNAA